MKISTNEMPTKWNVNLFDIERKSDSASEECVNVINTRIPIIEHHLE